MQVPAPGAGETKVQLLRTVPEHVYDRMHDGAFGILEAYMRAVRSARELVYLESQFFWLPELVALLAGKLREPPSARFRVVVLLPSKPNNGEEDTRGMLADLVDADDGHGRFLATTLDAMTGSTVDPLYVHAKIGIVDDRWLTIGSANLNAHSFFNDTEVNVQVCDPALARATRLRLWSEHLGLPEEEVAGDPADVVDRLWIPSRAARRAAPGGRRASTACASCGRAPASSSGCSARWTRSSSTLSGARQPHVERRAGVRRVEREAAAVALLDDPAHGVEAEAGPAADGLGREERLEDVGAASSGMPGPLSAISTCDAVAVGARPHRDRARRRPARRSRCRSGSSRPG